MGFSLIELVVVLALVTVLGFGAASALGPTRGRVMLWLATTQVMRDLSAARMRAIAENQDHRLVFSAASSEYVLERIDGSSADPVGEPIALPLGVSVQSCSARDGALHFRPRGNAASFGTITLASGGDTAKVIVNITGHARSG
ncbi:MAG TPA: GspH/FimT family protein [Terriglobales bacterium]|nr:GspH/FimT family protein [Terriglobales bacterium]